MPQLATISSSKVVGLIGSEAAGRVTNLNSSGTLYVGPQDSLTASAYTYSIAAGASQIIPGPAAAVGSTDVRVLVQEYAVPDRPPNPTSRHSNFAHLGGTAAGLAATSTTPVAGTAYLSAINIPNRCTLTGIGYLIGATGGTDKATVCLWDKDGVVLAYSALAGTTVGTNDTFQELPFTATYEVLTPGKFHIGVGYDGTTARIATAPVVGAVKSKTQAVTFVTSTTPLAIATVPTTSATVTAPIAYVY